jgi:SAM-dependent methyltransferase
MSVQNLLFPPNFFRRIDETDDGDFYSFPRLVTHIDDATIAALTQVYRELVPAGGSVLDLMASWVSHLPAEIAYRRVAGLGMNQAELASNERLTERVVHDLNVDPRLPFPESSFDAVLNAVSIQYLTRPFEVFASVREVLAPGGVHVVAFSHRMFPTKAVLGWQALDAEGKIGLVRGYFALSVGWTETEVLDRSPRDADPLWVVFARRAV